MTLRSGEREGLGVGGTLPSPPPPRLGQASSQLPAPAGDTGPATHTPSSGPAASPGPSLLSAAHGHSGDHPG